MSEMPKWLDDLIWCGKPVTPSEIEYPKDPPGVFGPNTLRELQRTMAPMNAMNHYTPVEIEFAPTDYEEVKRHFKLITEARSGLPSLVGLRISQNALLPPGFALRRFADKRYDIVKIAPDGERTSVTPVSIE